MERLVEVTLEIDAELKEQAEKVFAENGMTLEEATILFFEETVRLGRLPFELDDDLREYIAKQLDTPACALPGFVDSKNEEKTERNAGYLVVSHSGGGMLRQGTRKGIRRTPANRGMRAHWVVKGLDISEDVCHGMCP